MAASSSICCSFTPQATPLNHSSSAAAPLSALCAPFSLKPLPKLVISLYSRDIYARTKSGFIPSVAISSDLEEDVEDEEDDEGSLNFSEREERSFSPDAKLFVGNLPFTVDSAELAGLFGRAGTVEMVEVIYDKFSGRSRGFGFVTMSSAEEAEAAAEQFNGYELQGRPMRVNSGPPPPKRDNSSFQSGRENSSFRTSRDNSSFRASRDHPSFRASRDDSSYQMGRERSSFRTGRDRERSSSDDSNKLYVGNLAWGVDNLALESLFGEQGRVKEARVVYDRESGRSRGFGFVTYSSPEEMDHAIEVLDGFDLDGRSIRVSPAEARPAREF